MSVASRRPMMAAVGCAIILTVGMGSTSLLNAIAVLLVEGMGIDLVTYAFGPMLATIFAFLGSLVGTKLIDRLTPKWCLLIGSICTTCALLLFAAATGPVNGFSAYSSNFLASGSLDPSFVVTLLSIFALLVAVVSLVSGKVSEKLGASVSSIIVFAGFAAGITLLVMWLANAGSPLLYGGLVLCAFIGPVQILPALFIPQLFGMRDYTAINAVGMGAFYLGGAAVFLIAAAIMQNVGFAVGFIVLAASGVVACILFLLAIAASPIRKKGADVSLP